MRPAPGTAPKVLAVVALIALVALIAAPTAPAGAASRKTASRKTARTPDLTVVDLNLLHGAFCPTTTNQCDAAGRVALLMSDLRDAKCPDVVGLEEISRPLYTLIKPAAKKLCGGRYQVVFGPPAGIDTELVLTTLPVTSQKVVKLFGGFRTASRVTLQSDLGPVALVVTHQDGDPAGPVVPCGTHCPPVCPPATGAFECQTVAAEALADGRDDRGSIRLLMGDFNVGPASVRYQNLLANGWLDAYVEAGNPECQPATGVGCTSGRDDKTLTSLQDPSNRETERIDFVFVKPPSSCRPRFDSADDANGNGLGTGLFASTPAVGVAGDLAWPSDHIGVSMDMSCAKPAKNNKTQPTKTQPKKTQKGTS